MRIRSLALAGAVAGTILVSGVAVADIPDAGVFHACVQNRKDADAQRVVRLIDLSNRHRRAHLDLGPGTYVLQAKLPYRNNGATRQTGSCIFQGAGIGGLDGSQQNVDAGGEQNGQADGVLTDIVIKRQGDPTDVHLQCFGPGDGSIHIINAILVATLPRTLKLR